MVWQHRMVSLRPRLTAPRGRLDTHSPEMLGTGGMLRSTQPLRILAAAAELGLLPHDLPVWVEGRPLLPSTRRAMRRLQAAHANVQVIG